MANTLETKVPARRHRPGRREGKHSLVEFRKSWQEKPQNRLSTVGQQSMTAGDFRTLPDMPKGSQERQCRAVPPTEEPTPGLDRSMKLSRQALEEISVNDLYTSSTPLDPDQKRHVGTRHLPNKTRSVVSYYCATRPQNQQQDMSIPACCPLHHTRGPPLRHFHTLPYTGPAAGH